MYPVVVVVVTVFRLDAGHTSALWPRGNSPKKKDHNDTSKSRIQT